jgi:hypothetical protein
MNPELLDKIIAFEQGELTSKEVVELFRILVDSGVAWELQGIYGRMAWQLMEQGFVKIPERMIQ